ncbi:hypothetical protein AZA_88775 [Nitrospirillum viridazoti Y2]|nr:hypothetical protein AZA_88775 [Nitrospirillum amazonense Y2]
MSGLQNEEAKPPDGGARRLRGHEIIIQSADCQPAAQAEYYSLQPPRSGAAEERTP